MLKETSPKAMALSCGWTQRRVSSMDPTSDVEWIRTKREKMAMYHMSMSPHCNEQCPFTAHASACRHAHSENSYCNKKK